MMSTCGSFFVSEVLRPKFTKDRYVCRLKLGDDCEDSGYGSAWQERLSMRSLCVVFSAKYHLVKAALQACCQDPDVITLT